MSSIQINKINKFNFSSTIKALGYKVEEEFKFAPKRKFRADWKVTHNNKSCLVEYEGIICAKSRHTNLLGYTTDCEKYNLAQLLGYPIFRYTQLNFQNVLKDLEDYFNK